MEKETVLEIEFKQVWDKWAYRITKNELFNLRGELKEYENKALQLKLKKEYESSFLYSLIRILKYLIIRYFLQTRKED